MNTFTQDAATIRRLAAEHFNNPAKNAAIEHRAELLRVAMRAAGDKEAHAAALQAWRDYMPEYRRIMQGGN